MLILFSIASKGGIEVFSYRTKRSQKILVERNLLSSFMEAIQIFSESMGAPIKTIQLSNMMIYIQTYGNFTLRLITEKKIEESELMNYFDLLATEVSKYQISMGNIKNLDTTFSEKIISILSPIIYDETIKKSEFIKSTKNDIITKIAIAGLEKAGKTSIKQNFFENWTKDKIKLIKPTLGVDISNKNVEFLEKGFIVLDFGGQEGYRKDHLKLVNLWKNISTLIYVIDIQEKKTFVQSKEYFSSILNTIIKFNKKLPSIALFLHKNDPIMKEKLTKNVNIFYQEFKEFVNLVNIHLTTIEDDSSNVALIKTLYFSLPEIILKKLLEEEFLYEFEKNHLPRFRLLASLPNFDELYRKSIESLYKSAVFSGLATGLKLKKSWLNYLLGKWTPKQLPITSNSLIVKQEESYLLIKIPHWTNEVIPSELTKLYLDGMLEGILKSLYMDSPQKIEDNHSFITWKISLK